jgi:hypothetical protein
MTSEGVRLREYCNLLLNRLHEECLGRIGHTWLRGGFGEYRRHVVGTCGMVRSTVVQARVPHDTPVWNCISLNDTSH